LSAKLHPALIPATSKKACVPVIAMDKRGLSRWTQKATKAHKAWVKSRGFKADKGKILSMPAANGTIECVLWGCDEGRLPDDPWAYASLARRLPAGQYQLPAKISTATALEAALGWALSTYAFVRYVAAAGAPTRLLKLPKSVDRDKLRALIRAIFLVRDLINTPTNDMGPGELAAAARAMARQYKATTKIIVGDKLLEANFPTIHAVGRASINAPRLIDIRWGKKSNPTVTLVGKGVVFDSGGLGIKTAAGMRLMKKDMGGAAHVLGLASAIMALNLAVRLRVLIPAVENSISANAYRPGDVIKTRKGLSVEIGHTDAEGRLVLCDALALADEEGPELLIDFATLTGAARVALGADLPAMFTDNDKLATGLSKAGADSHDPIWRLPLWQGYAGDLSSNIADLNNMADGGFAGATMGALFLDHFVEKAGDWVHFDVYGWNQRPRPGRTKGGNAQGLRAVLSYLEARYG
jgi:leucyl aminopeptidase